MASHAKPPSSHIGLPVFDFANLNAFAGWISTNYAQPGSVWLRFYNKGIGVPTTSYQEALDVALCWGWIDSQIKKIDHLSCIRKFSQRRPKSMWSETNKAHITRLTAARLMQPTGLAEVAKAKSDGRWDAAYVAQRDAKIPTDLDQWVKTQKKPVQTFVENLSRSQLFSIYFQLRSAKKPETRLRRLDVIKAALLQLQNPY
jgi:uncharacterized protein YdeI (YjbR/CyaY-like superfamily)